MHPSEATLRREPGSPWTAAILAALLTHLLALGAIEGLGLFEPPDALSRPEPLHFVFSPTAPDPAADSEEPTQFSELPEDRADLRPEDPDFLSNVDSRARDRAQASAETDLPRMEGQSDAPHVALEEPAAQALAEQAGEEGMRDEVADSESGGEQSPLASEAAQEQAARLREGQALRELLRDPATGRPGDPGEGASSPSGRPGSGNGDVIREAPGTEPRYSLRANGQAFFQEEMNNPLGNVSLFGDISLNTLNWEFAPWIQRFVRDYHRNWFPPYAYGALGLISGYQLVDLEVAPNGRLLSLKVVEESGHEALTESTLTTFRAFAPYHPLPADFPEPTLKLRVKVVYPELRRGPEPRR